MFKKVLLLSLIFFSVVNASASDRMRFLFKDREALQARVDIIQQAEKEILVEYFSVWNDDQSVGGMALLVAAAQRGVKVKIIVDALANTVPNSLFAAFTRFGVDNKSNKNLEIRIYNPAYSLNLLKLTHRDHAKMLVVDNDIVITGGRNIGDKYFGLSEERNFDDLDVIADGSIAPRMRENFLQVWNSSIVETPNLYEYSEKQLEPVYCLTQGEAMDECERRRLNAIDKIEKEMARIEKSLKDFLLPGKGQIVDSQTGKDWLNSRSHSIDQIKFFSHEASELVNKSNNYMSQELFRIISETQNEIVMVAPYLIPTPDLMAEFKILMSRGIKIKVITNSLRSTDNLFAQAGYRKYKDKFIKMGFEIYEYNGPNTIHAKAAVVDGTLALVGTYNVDPRSAYINREIGLGFQESAGHHPISDELLEYVRIYQERSILVGKDGQEYNKDLEFQGVSKAKILALKAINFFLPLIEGQL